MTIEEGFAAIVKRGWRVLDFTNTGSGESRYWLEVYPGFLGRHHKGLRTLTVDGRDAKVTFQNALNAIHQEQMTGHNLLGRLQDAMEAWLDRERT